MVQIKPNANFYSLGGVSVHNKNLEEYQKYRRSWNELPSNFILRDFPMHLDIEITNRCNLKCVFCDKLPLLKKGRIGDMEHKTFKKIVDEAAKYRLWGLKLSYRGEPLLHKDVIKMIAYAKNKGILDIYFNTNGMLLDKGVSEQLIDAGLDRISISIEGIDAEVFEKNRIGANFKVILNNVDTLMKIRKRRGVDHPKIRIQTIYSLDINLVAYKNFWAKHCDEVAAVDFKDVKNRKLGIVYDWACPQLWQRMTIQWDGTILPCNNDDFCCFSLGNVSDKTIYESWHSKSINQSRQLHRKGQAHKLKACDGCPWRTAQVEKLKSIRA